MMAEAVQGLSSVLCVSPLWQVLWLWFCIVATQSAAGGCLAFSMHVVQGQAHWAALPRGLWEV